MQKQLVPFVVAVLERNSGGGASGGARIFSPCGAAGRKQSEQGPN